MIHEIETIHRLTHEIDRRTHQMALDLTKLNAAVAAIETKLTALAAEIATLKGAPPATDHAYAIARTFSLRSSNRRVYVATFWKAESCGRCRRTLERS